MDRLNILYRGPLSSCNYDCFYCPFAKRKESSAELNRDRAALRRFVSWLKERANRPHGVFFTPWGEALIRRWYRDSMIEMSHWQHIARVAIQTNLSSPLSWLSEARIERLAFWCTYHPDEVTLERFVAQCHSLDLHKARYSVGVVGLKQHTEQIRRLRNALPEHVYMWINAPKSSPDLYDESLLEFFTSLDPLYPFNRSYHASLGQECNTGLTTISVDGDGAVRRCHFISENLGNIYDQPVELLLRPRLCTRATCGCHIGYVHMPRLNLSSLFGENILERIPDRTADQGTSSTPTAALRHP